MIKTGNENILKNKIDLQISTDEEKVVDDKYKDKLFATENLEEVVDVLSSHVTSSDVTS